LPLVELPGYRLAVLPPVNPAVDQDVQRLWVSLSLRLEEGLKSATPGVLSVGVVDRRGSMASYALGVPLDAADVSIPEGLRELRTPPGYYLNHTVTGPYAAIPAAFEMLGRQVQQAGARRTGLDLEVYRPPDAEGGTRTDIFIGIADGNGE
jgi:hypothetical protein